MDLQCFEYILLARFAYPEYYIRPQLNFTTSIYIRPYRCLYPRLWAHSFIYRIYCSAAVSRLRLGLIMCCRPVKSPVVPWMWEFVIVLSGEGKPVVGHLCDSSIAAYQRPLRLSVLAHHSCSLSPTLMLSLTHLANLPFHSKLHFPSTRLSGTTTKTAIRSVSL